MLLNDRSPARFAAVTLQDYARLTTLVNKKNIDLQPAKVYPIPAVALGLASALATPPPADTVETVVQRAEAAGQAWTHPAPTNVLLLADGNPTGAVADIMSVEMSGTTEGSVITLTLDVVHKPHVISEVQEHGVQTPLLITTSSCLPV